MKEYFYLQFVMANRRIREVGLNPVVGYILGLAAFIFLSYYLFENSEFAKYLVILSCLSLLFNLSEKRRTEFLLATFGNKLENRIRILENIIISLPFLIVLIYYNAFLESLLLLGIAILIAAFTFQINFNFSIPTPFSKRPFEFLVGFRKTFFMYPIAYILTGLAINADNLNLGIFSMILVFLTALNYYTKPEDEFYIWIHAETPNTFLLNKIITATKYSSLLVLPILVSLLIFFPADFKWPLLIFMFGLLFIWTIILAKYSAYPLKMNIPEGILIALSVYFPPLLLAVMPYLYFKSINNLKVVLDD
ncbi:MAG: hypothetical protein K9J12_02330 [Melioribacteraceae bacterium]|nr:hypothetical protein [Melioribacteraceae bacterium]